MAWIGVSSPGVDWPPVVHSWIGSLRLAPLREGILLIQQDVSTSGMGMSLAANANIHYNMHKAGVLAPALFSPQES